MLKHISLNNKLQSVDLEHGNDSTNGHRPMVSVIMPVYNVESYVIEAVNSVLKQTLSDFELLIIDDESPDNSIQKIKGSFDDARITILSQKNRGLAGARNTGIRYAKGQFIAFLDSDDYWDKNKLKCHYQDFEQYPHCGVSFCSSLFVDNYSKSLNRLQRPKRKNDFQAKHIFTRNPIGNGSVPVIRKSVLEQIAFTGIGKDGHTKDYLQYFDESLTQSEDIDCWVRIAILTGTDFIYIDKPLTYYRVNNEGLSSDVDTQYETWLVFYRKLSKISPNFCRKHGPTAKAFQCRYLARRCVSQAQGKDAFKWMCRAFKYQPFVLMSEFGKTAITSVASIVMAVLPRSAQQGLVKQFLQQRF